MVNGVSVNRRAEAMLEGASDFMGYAEMYRDYKLLGALMSEGVQRNTVELMKTRLQKELGIRLLPSPEALGANEFIGGPTIHSNADLIDRYGDALRKVGMWKESIIELDTRSMLITSIGKNRMNREDWINANVKLYQ
jgi:hypothetical protein